MVGKALLSTWIVNVTQILSVVSHKFKLKFSVQYIAKIIIAACNSRIPQANLHVGLKFCTCKELQL